jgi:serine protease Do
MNPTPGRPRSPWARTLLALMCAGSLIYAGSIVATAGGAAAQAAVLEPGDGAQGRQVHARPNGGVEQRAIASAQELGHAFTTVAERVSPAVVSVRVQATLPAGAGGPLPFGPFGPAPPEDGFAHGNGSGLVIRPDGYVLTNNHVIQHAVRIQVQLQDGRRYDAEVVGTDPATDLAVLRIAARGLPALTFADSNTVRPGQWAIAIGSPFGLDYSVTTGVVSSVGRGGLGMNEIEDYIQTDASINPGNSGGPLVDLDGRVIGVNTMIVGRGTGIGFAVSSELARRVTNQILTHGEVRRPWIGVSFQELTPELASAFSLGNRARGGALIADVVPDGPAARAGLQPGDVVVSVDGQPVEEGRDLLRAVLQREVGARVQLQVVREGQRVPVALVTTARPGEGRSAPTPPRAPPVRRSPTDGLSLAPLTPTQRSQLGAAGALVTDVAPGSEADRAGLRRGDVIVEADGQGVGAPDEVARAVSSGRVLLRVRRGDNAFFTVLAS